MYIRGSRKKIWWSMIPPGPRHYSEDGRKDVIMREKLYDNSFRIDFLLRSNRRTLRDSVWKERKIEKLRKKMPKRIWKMVGKIVDKILNIAANE